MDTLLGICGKDWVLMATDSMVGRSFIVLKNDMDKMVKLGSNALLSYSGDMGDCGQFVDYIVRNVALYGITKGYPLSTKGVASYVRQELSDSLRTRNAYQVNLLLAGLDNDVPGLYFVDYLGTLQKMNTAAHGYASYFCYSLMDKFYRPDMSKEEGIELMKKCLEELKRRYLIETPGFIVRCITKEGIAVVPELTIESLKA